MSKSTSQAPPCFLQFSLYRWRQGFSFISKVFAVLLTFEKPAVKQFCSEEKQTWLNIDLSCAILSNFLWSRGWNEKYSTTGSNNVGAASSYKFTYYFFPSHKNLPSPPVLLNNSEQCSHILINITNIQNSNEGS